MFPASAIRTLSLLVFMANAATAGIVINEFMAAASDRRISWNMHGAPRLGSGIQWMDNQFVPTGWSWGSLPAGYGFSGLGTNLIAVMRDKACSLYLRKQFVVSSDVSSITNRLVLSVQFNDGFVAYLNGREIARANCGPTNHFMFASQPAYNVNSSPGFFEYPVGLASERLLRGINVLAIQAHNADKPEQISAHVPTPEFRIDAGLRVKGADNTLPDTVLINSGPVGPWHMYVGRAEPSGGVADLGLVNRVFAPPTGEEGDYEEPADLVDWVELYNDADAAVNLSNWSLSDDTRNPAKWRIPANTYIPARGYLLILCDDREEANAPLGPALRLHAGFKLDAEGEPLALYDDSGRFIDGFVAGYPEQVPFCSYGRNPARPIEFVYLDCATPGAKNSGSTYPARVRAPVFRNAQGKELSGGLYPNQPLTLYLTSATSGAEIRYTLDGSEPSEGSLIYTTPLTISQQNDKVAVVVRACAMVRGWLPSATVTHSYVLRQSALLTGNPTLMLSGTPGRTFYPPQGVLSVVGGGFSNSLWYPLSHNSYNIAVGSGAGYERESWIECFFPSNYFSKPGQAFRAGAGLRISASPWQRPRMNLNVAATSSPWPQRDTTQKPSFNIYFSGDYGPGSLPFTIFTNSTVHEYRHLRLRAGKNDNYNPFITDELARRLSIDLGLAGSRGLFCSLYVNGIYKGVYNLCERLREPFFQAHYQNFAEWDVCYSGAWVNGDNSASQRLLTSLDRELNSPANWESATNQVDIDSAIDYYLLNIYGATWDWPGNNYVLARPRVSGPEGRFRFAVWDAEGFFQVVTTTKPINYNTLANDLLVSSSNPNYYGLITRIFRRLWTNADFRLRFADRVNLHMFNQGVLDDRDPDFAGPLKSHFRERLDDLVAEAGNLVRYNTGQALNSAPFLAWTSPGGGRRAYLLGNTPGRQMFRDAGLWPRTEPPIFSQHGGMVPPGFSLSITSYVAQAGQTSIIFFTTNGADPRLGPGPGAQKGAVLYTNPFSLESVHTISARAFNPASGEWSPLTTATFSVAAVSPSSNNIAVAEIMYHPPAETPAELAAGFQNADDFEFLRLQNIGNSPVDLRELRCASGVIFAFSSGKIHFLAPGASVLVVKNEAALRTRYGQPVVGLIAGQYDGNLANSGERLLLMAAGGAVVKDFTYLDRAPWPEAADGQGCSLMLKAPGDCPDHSRAENWMASSAPGGMPAGIPQALDYEQWRMLFWENPGATNEVVSGRKADPDGDGIPNFTEYATGMNPHAFEAAPRVTAKAEADGTELRLILKVPFNPGAREAGLSWQFRDAHGSWVEDDNFELVEAVPLPGGNVLRTYISRETPASSIDARLLRGILKW